MTLYSEAKYPFAHSFIQKNLLDIFSVPHITLGNASNVVKSQTVADRTPLLRPPDTTDSPLWPVPNTACNFSPAVLCAHIHSLTQSCVC